MCVYAGSPAAYHRNYDGDESVECVWSVRALSNMRLAVCGGSRTWHTIAHRVYLLLLLTLHARADGGSAVHTLHQEQEGTHNTRCVYVQYMSVWYVQHLYVEHYIMCAHVVIWYVCRVVVKLGASRAPPNGIIKLLLHMQRAILCIWANDGGGGCSSTRTAEGTSECGYYGKREGVNGLQMFTLTDT